MADTFYRYLLLLRAIPPAPNRVDTLRLTRQLHSHGIHVSRRTVQRDLERLSQHLPLDCNDKTRPYGWAWLSSARAAREGADGLREVVLKVAGSVRR
jgi:hypothetical protein